MSLGLFARCASLLVLLAAVCTAAPKLNAAGKSKLKKNIAIGCLQLFSNFKVNYLHSLLYSVYSKCKFNLH